MNWVDIAAIAIVVFSGLLGLLRGLTREVLSVVAWVGAATLAIWAAPSAAPALDQWIHNPDLATPAAYALVFVVALVFFSIVAGIVGNVIAVSFLGGIDRTLGIVFGVVRGAVLISLAYIGLSKAVAPERWPPPLVQARAVPFAYEGATQLASLLPTEWGLTVPPPPGTRDARVRRPFKATTAGPRHWVALRLGELRCPST